MEKCRFCEILNGDRQNEEIVYEDDYFIVLTDKFRKTSVGSICLVIPKNHFKNILDLPPEYSEKLISILNLVNVALQKAFKSKAIRIWTAVNKEAGQSIFHCHIHLVPCNSLKDRIIASFPGIYDWKHRIFKLGNNKLESTVNFQLADKLRNQINTIKCQ
jgi:histidine triad (HIT) family protein